MAKITRVISVVEFPREGYKIKKVLGNRTIQPQGKVVYHKYCKESDKFCNFAFFS